MSRLQLALTVSDVDAATDFYSRLFAAQPAKRRPGYANFALSDPPLKLVLIEGAEGGSLNHLGVEVSAPKEVTDAVHRLNEAGLETRNEEGVECCYARQDKTWVMDPDGAPWEIYAVLGEADVMEKRPGTCCA